MARVLIADDSAAQRRFLAMIVESLGWRPHCVETGEQAVRACAKMRFDAILLDLQMPGAGGVEAARHIRRLGGWAAGAPIILVSAALTLETERRAASAGVDVCVAKPARPLQIVSALRQAFASRAAA